MPESTTTPADHRAALEREVVEDLRLEVLGAETVIRVHRYPASAGGAAPPRMLMVHGFRGDHHGMLRLVGQFDDVDVVVPDLPGFGASAPLPVPHTLEAFTAALEAVAEAEGFAAETSATGRTGSGDVILGHSFGSIVVAHHAASHRRGWQAVVLVCPISDAVLSGPLRPTPLLPSPLLPGVLAAEAYYRLCQVLPEPAGLALLRSSAALAVTNQTMITSSDAGLCDYIRDQHRRHFGGFADRRSVLEAYHTSSRHTVTEVAPEIREPVLLVTGTRDPLSTRGGLARLRSRLSRGQQEDLRGVGHLIHYEAPGAAARAVRRFVEAVDGCPPAESSPH